MKNIKKVIEKNSNGFEIWNNYDENGKLIHYKNRNN